MDPTDKPQTATVDRALHRPVAIVVDSVERRRGRRASRLGAGLIPVAIVSAILAVIVVGGALQRWPTSPQQNGVLNAAGLTLRYPVQWQSYLVSAGGASFAYQAVLSTDELSGCSFAGLPIEVDCALGHPLSPGAVRVLIGSGGIPGFAFADLEPQGGWELFVDGQPATIEVQVPPDGHESEMTIIWRIAHPSVAGNFYMVDAMLRGPGLDRERAELDALIRTIRFGDGPSD